MSFRLFVGATFLAAFGGLFYFITADANARVKPATLGAVVCQTADLCSMSFQAKDLVIREQNDGAVITVLKSPTITIVQNRFGGSWVTSYSLDYDLYNVTHGGSATIYIWLQDWSGTQNLLGIMESPDKMWCWDNGLKHSQGQPFFPKVPITTYILDKLSKYASSQEPFVDKTIACPPH